jgi:hypothetical protein
MDTIKELREYLRLRDAAEGYYRNHPSIAALIADLHASAPDKLTPNACREAYEITELALRQANPRAITPVNSETQDSLSMSKP